MTSPMDVFLAGLIGALIGAAIVVLGYLVLHWINDVFKRIDLVENEIRDLKSNNQDLIRRNEELRRQVDDLVAVKERARQTGSTMAGLEEAMAHIIRIKYNRDVDNHALECALNMLQTLRQGPYAYDPNQQPAGERKDYL